MENYPYLYGQLLKASDELHAMYCKAVRDGKLPPQLVGGALYQAAANAPERTLCLLGQRMIPYINWAKSYRTKNIEEKGIESWKVGCLLIIYEKTATKLLEAWDPDTRFDDAAKAQLFLGYLAKFPGKEGAEKEAGNDGTGTGNPDGTEGTESTNRPADTAGTEGTAKTENVTDTEQEGIENGNDSDGTI